VDLQGFINQYNGRFANFPGGDGGQCVDLVEFWITGNGFPRFFGNAINAAGQHWPGATWTPNSPSGVPSPGDVVVWGTAVGSAGHVDVFVSGNASGFTGFDQNWPIGSVCHLQGHNYNGVLGWQALHLVPAPAPPPSFPPPPLPTPAPPPVVPPLAAMAPIAPALVLLAAGGLAGWTFWHHRRAGVPITPQTLLQDVRDGLHGAEGLALRGEHLAGAGLGELEREALALRRRLPV
jgi:CHAP domain